MRARRPAGHVVETKMRKAGILWSNTLCGVLHVNAGDRQEGGAGARRAVRQARREQTLAHGPAGIVRCCQKRCAQPYAQLTLDEFPSRVPTGDTTAGCAVSRMFPRSILAALESAPLSSGWLHVVSGSGNTAPWGGCTPAMLSAMRDDTLLCGGATGSSAPSAVSSASAVPPPTTGPAGSSPAPSRGPATRMHAAPSRPQPQQPAARQCAASVAAGPRMRQQERACAAARHVRPSAAVTSAVAAGASSPPLLAPSPRVSAVTVYPCTSARLQQQPTTAIDSRERRRFHTRPPYQQLGWTTGAQHTSESQARVRRKFAITASPAAAAGRECDRNHQARHPLHVGAAASNDFTFFFTAG